MKFLLLVMFLILPAGVQAQNEILYVVPDDSGYQIRVTNVADGSHTDIDHIGALGSDAGWSPEGRYIHIVDYAEDGSRFLKLVDFKTGESQIITRQLMQDDCTPAMSWSPDGRFVSYHTEQQEQIWLHVFDTQDNQTYNLPNPITINRWVTWSPDSRYLNVVVQSPQDQSTSLLMWDLFTDQIAATLNSDGYSGLSWSPDTRFLAYKPLDDDLVIEVYNLSTDEKQRYSGQRVGQWSPDGRYLIFYRHDEANHPQPLILETQENRIFQIGEPLMITNNIGWSPDSRYVAYTVPQSQAHSLYVLDVLTETTETLVSDIPYIQRVRWSPVGHVLAFTSSPDSPKGNTTHFTTIDMDTDRVEEFKVSIPDIVYDQPLRWSPDGQHLALYTVNGISIYDHASEQLKPASESIPNTLPPRWSPDGHYLSFYSFTPDKRDIYVIDTQNDLQLQNITNTPNEDEVFIGWRGSNDNRSLIYCGIG